MCMHVRLCVYVFVSKLTFFSFSFGKKKLQFHLNFVVPIREEKKKRKKKKEKKRKEYY